MRWDTVALVLAALPALVFVILYLRELKYVRPTPESRHLIGFTAILALILLEELSRRVFRDFISTPVHRVFVALAVTAAAIFLWQRLYMLLRYQIIPRKKRRRQRKPPKLPV